jgi:Protein of unknown function (DUF2950)
VDSAAAAVVVDSMAVAEGDGNMTLRTFTLAFVVAMSPVFGQVTQSLPPAVPPGVPVHSTPKVPQKTFDSPEEATQALIDATGKNDTATLKSILGSSAKGILTSGDPKQDEAERQEFAKIAGQKHHLEKSSMNSHVMVLLIGDQDWPFPIPLLHDGQKWRFDSDRGAVEVRAREIGSNELDAIEACAGYVSVQQAYAAKKRTPAGTQEYAETVATSELPKELINAAGDHPTRPYHGYYFKALKGQGPNAPGGQHSYMIGKAVIGGFGLVAWPANYGVTGIHTFIVNQDGTVYEKDLGARPPASVTTYDPDPSWKPVD